MGKRITRIYDKNKVMSRKKYLLLIIAILVLEIAVYLGAFSKAEVIKSIEYVELDTQEAYTSSIEVNTDETGDYIILPAEVNGATVSKYYINEAEYAPNTNYYITEAQESISVTVKYAEAEATPTPEVTLEPTTSPTATVSPTVSPEASAEQTASPETSPDASAEPEATPTVSPGASTEPTASPETSPDASASPTASPETSPSPTPTATPEATPEIMLMATTTTSTKDIVYFSTVINTDVKDGTKGNPFMDFSVAVDTVKTNGTIYIIGSSDTAIEWPTSLQNNKTITITGAEDEEYKTYTHGLKMGDDWSLGGNTTIKGITITGNKTIYANGYELVLGEESTTNLETGAVDEQYPNVYAGSTSGTIQKTTDSSGNQVKDGNTTLTIHSGTYNNVYGGSAAGTIAGSVNLTITAGTYNNVYGGSAAGTIAGSVNLTITGGTITNIYAGQVGGTTGNNIKVTNCQPTNGNDEINLYTLDNTNLTLTSSILSIKNSESSIFLGNVNLSNASTLKFNNGAEKKVTFAGNVNISNDSTLAFDDLYNVYIHGNIASEAIYITINELEGTYHDIEIQTNGKYAKDKIKLNDTSYEYTLDNEDETQREFWYFYWKEEEAEIPTVDSQDNCIYVSVNGSDSATGTAQAPVYSIKKAYEIAKNDETTQKTIVLMTDINLNTNGTSGDGKVTINLVPKISSTDGVNNFNGNIILSADTTIYQDMILNENIMIIGSTTEARSININGNNVTIGESIATQGLINIYADGTAFNILGGTWNDVYGGSNSVDISDTNLTITGGTYTGNIYGGSNLKNISGDTNLTINGGTFIGNIFAGSNSANISGNANLTINGGNFLKATYGGNNSSSTIGGKINVTINNGNFNTSNARIFLKDNTTDSNTFVATAENKEKKILTITGGTFSSSIYLYRRNS